MRVYLLLLTVDHECLLDFSNGTLGVPFFDGEDATKGLQTARQILLQNFDLKFPKFLGSFKDEPGRILVFRVDDYRFQRAKLQPTRLTRAFAEGAALQDFFWRAYEKVILKGYTLPHKNMEIWAFGHGREDASYLVCLILSGMKSASSSLLWSYDYDDEPPPQVNRISVIRDQDGDALAVVQTTRVDIVPFHSIPEDFMKKEGEKDQSVDQWRRSHWEFFAEECDAMGIEPDENMPIVCETFELLCPLAPW
jgi:uncharacterized protein YhfF